MDISHQLQPTSHNLSGTIWFPDANMASPCSRATYSARRQIVQRMVHTRCPKLNTRRALWSQPIYKAIENLMACKMTGRGDDVQFNQGVPVAKGRRCAGQRRGPCGGVNRGVPRVCRHRLHGPPATVGCFPPPFQRRHARKWCS